MSKNPFNNPYILNQFGKNNPYGSANPYARLLTTQNVNVNNADPSTMELVDLKNKQQMISNQLIEAGKNTTTGGGAGLGIIAGIMGRQKINELEGKYQEAMKRKMEAQIQETQMMQEAYKTNDWSKLLTSSNPKIRQMVLEQKLKGGGDLKSKIGVMINDMNSLKKQRDDMASSGQDTTQIDSYIKNLQTGIETHAKNAGGVNVKIQNVPPVKIPQGMQFIPLKDKEGKIIRDDSGNPVPSHFEPVPGGKERTAEQSSKSTGAASGIKIVDDMLNGYNQSVNGKDTPVPGIYGKDGKIDRTLVGTLYVGAPGTWGGHHRARLEDAIQTKLRIETGAAAPHTEVKNILSRFLPTPVDKEATVIDKLNRLRDFYKGYLALSNPQMYRALREIKLKEEGVTDKAEVDRRINEEIRAGGVQNINKGIGGNSKAPTGNANGLTPQSPEIKSQPSVSSKSAERVLSHPVYGPQIKKIRDSNLPIEKKRQLLQQILNNMKSEKPDKTSGLFNPGQSAFSNQISNVNYLAQDER